jgi:hypothetical protein
MKMTGQYRPFLGGQLHRFFQARIHPQTIHQEILVMELI